MIDHKHEWYRANELVDYSPRSFRYCPGCGVVQVLKFSGWTDFIQITGQPEVF